MPRKSKRNKPKRNVNGIGGSSQQSQTTHASSLLKSSGKSDKEPNESYLPYHKLSALDYSRCSFLPPAAFSCKPEHERLLKSNKSHSTKISSPRLRSSGMASNYSGGSSNAKRLNISRPLHHNTHAQQLHETLRKLEAAGSAAMRKHSTDGSGSKHEKYEKQTVSSSSQSANTREQRHELRLKLEKLEKSTEKHLMAVRAAKAHEKFRDRSKERLHGGQKMEEDYAKNFIFEKYKADKLASAAAAALAVAVSDAAAHHRPTSTTISNTISGWEQVKSNANHHQQHQQHHRGSRQLNQSKTQSVTRITKASNAATHQLHQQQQQQLLQQRQPKHATENSPLANNRFYELSTRTPDTEESRSLRAHQGAIPKRKIMTTTLAPAGAAAQAKDDPTLGAYLTYDAHSQNGHGQKKFQTKKPTELFGTYLNVDGTRSQITNWQRNINLGPIWEPGSIYSSRRILPQPRPIVILPPSPLRRIESYCNFYKKNSRQSNNTNSNNNNNNSSATTQNYANITPKIAPLRNLCDPGREIWVNKSEYANSNTQRCVKILPSHHKCAGVERRLTPNDVDIENIACKLEEHERLSKSGSRTTPCTCFRPTRRSFCMNCKTNLIGRPFRKCRKHPDIGFSTDHYYCPFCLADAMLLKEL